MTDEIISLKRWERIADTLVFVDGMFPVDAVFEARDFWPEVRAGFLLELTLAVADPEDAIVSENMLPIYAMYLAAEKRDTAFAPVLLDLLKLPPDTIDELFGETALADGLPQSLAAVWQGSDEPLRAVAQDERLDDYVRLAAVETMKARVMEGDADHAVFTEFVYSLLQKAALSLPPPASRVGAKTKFEHYDEFFNLVLMILAELGATQYWPQIEEWHRAGLIDPILEDLNGLHKTVFASAEERRALMFKPCYIRDTVAEMSGWACFNEPEPTDTYTRAQPKIGRNDACPCGSGKKFKKCCGANL